MRGCLVLGVACLRQHICVPHIPHTPYIHTYTYINTPPHRPPSHTQHPSELHAKEDRIGSLQYQIARLQRQIDLLSASSSSSGGGAAGVAVSQPAAVLFRCLFVCLWLSDLVDVSRHVRLIPSSIPIRDTNKAEGRGIGVGVGVSGRRRQRGGAGGREGEQRGGGATWGGGVHVINKFGGRKMAG